MGGAAAEPMEFHVHRFETFACYVIGNDSKGCSIVSLHGRRGLWMPHFQERMARWDGLATVDEEGAKFGFGRRLHDVFDDLSNGEDGTIVRGIA